MGEGRDDTMDFSQALLRLKEGQAMRRLIWLDGVTVKAAPNPKGGEHLVYDGVTQTVTGWLPGARDLWGDDWVEGGSDG
jgi:hypothetical protein